MRYDVEENWAPWNCLLVSREEAAILSGIPNPKAVRCLSMYLILLLLLH